MKTEQPILITSVEAQSDLTKNLCVKVDGSLCSSEGDAFFGICNADTLEGEQAPIMVQGIALVYSGTSITAGNIVITSDDGQVSPIEPDSSVLPYVVGTALDSASASGELVRILLR